MFPSELKEALRRGLPCFVPCGCLENHGNQNPIGCDAFEAQDPLLLAAGKVPAVVAPTVWYGPTGYAVTGPELATTDINVQVFRNYMVGVVKGLAAVGFTNIVFVQVHQGSDGPEWTAMEMAIQSYRSSLYKQPGYGPGWAARMKQSEYRHADIEVIAPPHGQYDHAGKNETSWMLHLRGKHTDLKLVRPGDYRFCWQEGDEAVKASADWGRQMTERTVEALVELIRQKTLPSNSAAKRCV
jgi:creatinine amidohydrolase/Fe(II)-dependent formamide hydrolase-like protein